MPTQNSYEKEVFKAEQNDYYTQREYEFETALKQYDYNTEIQDYSYAQSLARYEKDLGIYESQLDYNVLDAYELGIQRPELHVSDKDCLHSYDLAVSDAINTVLLHYYE